MSDEEVLKHIWSSLRIFKLQLYWKLEHLKNIKLMVRYFIQNLVQNLITNKLLIVWVEHLFLQYDSQNSLKSSGGLDISLSEDLKFKQKIIVSDIGSWTSSNGWIWAIPTRNIVSYSIALTAMKHRALINLESLSNSRRKSPFEG